MRAVLLVVAAVVSWAGVLPASEPGDLDRLMERVLARRDENWKKLEQYVLDERETFDLAGPGGARLYGFSRDYRWFRRDGLFIRSPLRADGVALSEDQRRKAEAGWLRRERRRSERRSPRTAATAEPPAGSASPSDPSGDTVPALLEPAFVSYAYFLRFTFEPRHYALVGRDLLDGHAVLKIEYYPTMLFRDDHGGRNRERPDRDADVEAKMNKVSMVTLWVDPDRLQILQYTFDDISMDFLPGRSLARVDDVKATMRMGQPFPDVWLPRDIEMRFRMSLALGPVDARYRVEYHDYRRADVTYKVR